MAAWSGRDRCDTLAGYSSGMRAMGGDQGTRGTCAGICNGHTDTSRRCNFDRLSPLPPSASVGSLACELGRECPDLTGRHGGRGFHTVKKKA